jgi:foldase protein PrsA
MRRSLVTVFLACAAAGCQGGKVAWLDWGRGDREPPVSVPAAGAPATQPAPGGVVKPTVASTDPAPAPAPQAVAPTPERSARALMATVNGQPMYMDSLVDLLVRGHGMAIAQQLIANELVRQEAERQGLRVTDQDVEAEYQRTLRSMISWTQDPNQQQRALAELLAQKRVSRKQWDLTMRRNALLAKLAAKNLTVSEAELREEFGRQYQRQVEVQHIQTATLADAQKILRMLASGREFAELAIKHSTGASAKSGGLFPPFGAKSVGVPLAIRQAALAMSRIGEVSDPIQVGTAFHIIKLVRIIETKEVKFEDVKDDLAEIVKRQKTRAIQQEILLRLIRGAKVEYVEPTLRAEAAERDQP